MPHIHRNRLIALIMGPVFGSVAGVSIVLESLIQQAIAQSPTYPITEIPCPTVLPPNEVEGKTITCGVFTVPENYADPDGRQIDLTYAVLHSRSFAPAPDPIVDLRGGPGAAPWKPDRWKSARKSMNPYAKPATLLCWISEALNSPISWAAPRWGRSPLASCSIPPVSTQACLTPC